MKISKRLLECGALLVVLLVVVKPGKLTAQPAVAPAPAAQNSVVCQSKAGARETCPANTTEGVALVRSSGSGVCLLGKTWGYDDNGVWVSDNCGGEFVLGQLAGPTTAALQAAATPDPETIETWGEFNPGSGFVVGKGPNGRLNISGYGLVRYVNQTPGEGTFTDHLGNTRTFDGRNDIWPHRVMIFFTGWLGSPKVFYSLVLWTVLDTNQNAIFATLGYQFNRSFSIYSGLNGAPGTRSLQGSHPYWLGQDRVMADEFFRPFFGGGVWAQGEPVKGLWYNTFAGTTSSSLGIKSSQLDRNYTTGASMWWMPTTKEFGPKGAYGDWESHEKLATRFGFSTVRSPEQRFTNSFGGTDNTTIRLADSINLYDTGALAPGITVDRANYRLLSIDAGMKYKGVFLQTEVYNRWLDKFIADGPVPLNSIHDQGFYIQGAFFPVKKKLEVYGATSQIYGDKDADFSNSSEVIGGMNFYVANSRNHRLNVQYIHVNHSTVSSAFGYYVGGQTGSTVSVGFSVYF